MSETGFSVLCSMALFMNVKMASWKTEPPGVINFLDEPNSGVMNREKLVMKNYFIQSLA